MRNLLLFFFIFCLQTAKAQWSQTNGPFGGPVTCLTKNDSSLFIGSNHGIFRSNDGGNSWQEVNNGLNIYNSYSGNTKAILATNSGIYTSLFSYGTFKSVDNGNSWQTINLGSPGNWVNCFDSIGTDIFAGTYGNGILISNDSGLSWNPINNGLLNLKINDIAHIDSILFAATDSGMYASNNYGNNWYPLSNGLNDTLFYDIHILGTRVLAKSIFKIYLSTDSGNNWTIAHNSTCNGGTFGQDDSVLYCGSNNLCNIISSTDSGSTWFQIPNNTLNDCYNICAWNGIIYAGSSNSGMHISTDHGQSWNVKNDGFIRTDNYYLLNNDAELWSSTSAGIFKTINNGLTWDSIVYNGRTLHSGFIKKFGNYIFAGVEDGIIRSSDNGNTWNLMNPLGKGPFVVQNGNLFATDINGILVSPDSGITWNNVNSALGSLGIFEMETKLNDLYLGTNNGVYLSTNQGVSWQQINSGLPGNSYVNKIAIKDSTLFCISNYSIYRSDNNGLYWNIKNFGVELYQFFDLWVNGFEIYAVGNYGVFVSLNNGDSWSPFNDSLENFAYYSSAITIFNNKLFLGTGYAGVWKHPLFSSIISGRIYKDSNNNCISDSSEAGLAKFGHSYWMPKASKQGVSYFGVPDTNGYYAIKVDVGTYDVSLINPAPVYSITCPPSQNYSLTVSTPTDTVNSIDFALEPNFLCSRMRTYVSATRFRPCINSYIIVEYCNEGTISEPNAVLTLNLPVEFTVLNSSIPWNSVSGNSYTYNIGLVQPGACGSIIILVDVLCDPAALTNATLCIRSEISPAEFCIIDSTWDQSSVLVDGVCLGDTSICFTIVNNGSDMQGSSQWRLYADNILIQQDSFRLMAGQDTTLCFIPTGQTFRLEADQRPNHPGNSHPNMSIERCGILGPFQSYSLGQILTNSLNNGLPYVSDYCAVIRNANDPNEKGVVPAGLGSHHTINGNNRLEYKIDFQNTGNDTAFVIVIKDSIDVSALDIATIDQGTSSHNFTFSIESPNVLVWTFNNIYLPDSNINEPMSHGFVNFSISPFQNLTSGTIVRNKAEIYFDFNQPVITNSVFNTICKNSPPLISFDGIDLFTIPSNSYQWYFGGNLIVGDTNQYCTPSFNGLYTVEISDANDCVSYSDTFNLVTLGVPAITNSNFKARLYPNPSNTYSTLSVIPAVSGKIFISVMGTDAKEQLLLTEQLALANQLMEIPIETKLKPGVYILKITIGEQQEHLRFVVMN